MNIDTLVGTVNGSIETQHVHFGGINAEVLLAQYYCQTAEGCEGITLAAINPAGTNRRKTHAEATYVPPDVWVVDDIKGDKKSAKLERESRRVPLQDCLNSDDAAMQRLVLTAPSGFGKSTAVNIRVGVIAKGNTPWLMLRLPALRLQVLAQGGGLTDERVEPVERALRKDIRDKVKCDETLSIVVATAVITRLDAAPGVILFDALDEVPHGEREEVVASVSSFLEQRARKKMAHRVLITSRPYAYTGQFDTDGFKRIDLAEFTPAQQDELVANWFKQSKKSKAIGAALTRQLQAARTGASADQVGLAQLMTEPMLLTYACMLAEGSTEPSDAPLPPTRHALFDGVVSLMLEQWDPNRAHGLVDAFKPLFERTGDKPSVLRGLLEQAALEELEAQAPVFDWDTQRKSKPARAAPNAVAQLARERIITRVDEAMPDTLPVRARKVVDWLAERSGLLHATSDEHGVRYALQAQLRDFLAVGGLRASAKTDDATVDALLRLFRNQPEWYRPLASMTLSRLRENPLLLAHAITQILVVPMEKDFSRSNPRVVPGELPLRHAFAILHFVIAWTNAYGAAGPCKANHSALETALKKLRERCLKLVTAPAEGKPPIDLRAEAADALGILGDPRFDPNRWHLPAKRMLSEADEPIPGFVRIAAGEFMMGDKREEDNPPRKVLIEHSFYIARYATTVAQFWHFVNAKGYEDPTLWDQDGLLWLNGEFDVRVQDEENRCRLRDRPPGMRRTPASWARQLQSPSSAVIGATWFEARAYARWLHGRLRPALRAALLTDYTALLPTEPQWERAARWAVNAKGYDARRWPYGDDGALARVHANLGKSLDRLAAVGLYEPTGPALFDIAGNTWEWTDNVYSSVGDQRFDRAPRNQSWVHAAEWKDSDRVSLRGSSWLEQSERASCSGCYSFRPDSWYDDVGFRVVLSKP